MIDYYVFVYSECIGVRIRWALPRGFSSIGGRGVLSVKNIFKV